MSQSTPRHGNDAVVLLLRVLARLPLSWVTALGAALAWLISWLPLSMASAYRATLVNIMLCYPELDYRSAARLARRALLETGRTLGEFSHVWCHPAEVSLARVKQVTGLDALRASYAAGRPVLLLTLHQSSWEIPCLVVGQEGPMTVFYQPGANEALNQLVVNGRQGTGATLVPADARGVKAGIAALNRREAVAILVDHTPHGSNNPSVPFFGHPVRTSNLTYKLIQRYQPDIYFVGCHRRSGAEDIAVYLEPAPASMYDADEATTLAEMNRVLAELISRWPEQYYWVYKRLRRRDGEKRRYYRKEVVPFLREARRRNSTLDVSRLP